MFDLIIAGGTIVDGTGRSSYRADVGIRGEFIEAIDDLSRAEAKRVIDAAGLTVSPGFIDTHTHAEGALLVDPQHANGLRQGITTEFLGIDGMSYAPLSQFNFQMYRHWLGGLLGDPPDNLDMTSVTAFRRHYHKKVSVNTAYFVPNATIRLQVVGFHDTALQADTLDDLCRLTRESLEQGAIGLTTGSKYYPGPWAGTQELIELCKIVRDANKVLMFAPRRNADSRAYGGGGITEAMEIVRKTGVRLHFAHHRTTPETAGQIHKILDPIDAERDMDPDITFDIYPYPSGSSISVSLLPSHAHEGGPQAIIRRLRDPAERTTIVEYLDTVEKAMLTAIIFSYLPNTPSLEGTKLRDLAADRGRSMGEVLCDVLLEQNLRVGHVGEPPSNEIWRQMNQDFMNLLARPDYMVCSDITPAGSYTHPRSYGAFPRFLGRLRREFGTLSLEAMVHRMTDRPARRFGLTKRGRIEKGYFADVTIFDEMRVNDNATYENPRQFPTGIPYVIVNGSIAVDNNQCTGVFAGQAIP